MSSGTLRIANPIYDGAFKYLLDDNRIARLFLSTLLEEEITELTFRPTEHRTDIEQRCLTVFRMDFAARVVQPNGEEKLVLIEIQKAKFATDIMRFRRYLGQQYCLKDNSYTRGGAERAMPIQSIYFLGHSLDHTKAPVVRVRRHCEDLLNRKPIEQREEFIESLTHDSLVVQIPHLSPRRQSDLECLLGLFDQGQVDPQNAHTLSINEEDYPPKFHDIVRRLVRAVSEPEVREKMQVEDDILEELEGLERSIAKKDEIIQEKDVALQTALQEKEAARQETEAALQEKDVALQEKDAALQEKDAALATAIKALMQQGLTEKQAEAALKGS
jgi:hypothetical protein